MTRNTVPPGSVVPTFLVELSESPELSAGKVSVVQITDADAPGRFDTMFFETSSIFTTARPLPSCPVTTRRTFTVMIPPRVASNSRHGLYGEHPRARAIIGRRCIIALGFGRVAARESQRNS